MVIGDFFHLDEGEYAKRIKGYTDERLMKQDVVKQRQITSGNFSVGTGIGGAPLSFGVTLAGSCYGARRMNVARRKLHLIQEELRSRGLQPHEATKRDFLIPLTACLISLGVSVGLGIGISAIAAANFIPIPVPTGGSAVHSAMSQPNAVLHGFTNGVGTQVGEVHAALTNGVGTQVAEVHAAPVTSDHIAAAGAAHAHHLIPLNPSSALGEYMGEAIAKAMEEKAASTAAAILVDGGLTAAMGNRSDEAKKKSE